MPRMAGAPASKASPTKAAERRRLLHQRRGDADAFGDVVKREAEHEEGAEPCGSGREGGTDREALAEVVQADPDRDGGRERQPGRGAPATADEPQQEEAGVAASTTITWPWNAAAASPASSSASSSESTNRKPSRPMVRASRKLMPLRPDPAQRGVEHQADRNRHDADKGAQHGLRHELARVAPPGSAPPPGSHDRRSFRFWSRP